MSLINHQGAVCIYMFLERCEECRRFWCFRNMRRTKVDGETFPERPRRSQNIILYGKWKMTAAFAAVREHVEAWRQLHWQHLLHWAQDLRFPLRCCLSFTVFSLEFLWQTCCSQMGEFAGEIWIQGGGRSGQSLLRGSVQSYGSIHQQRARLIISEQRLLVYTQRAQQTLTILQPFALAQFKSAVRGFGPTWKRVHVGQTTIPVWTVHINTVRGRWWKGGYEWYHDEDIWWQHDGVKHIVCI